MYDRSAVVRKNFKILRDSAERTKVFHTAYKLDVVILVAWLYISKKEDKAHK